jgi:CO dehydrogenase maturation factor
MCRAHATVRGLVGELVSRQDDERDLVIDMEAGLEHLSRGTARHVSTFVAVMEPYFRSMETARRAAALAMEAQIERVVVVANKVRDDEDLEAIEAFCEGHGLRLLTTVPYDESLTRCERGGEAPIDYDESAPAVRAIRQLAQVLAD